MMERKFFRILIPLIIVVCWSNVVVGQQREYKIKWLGTIGKLYVNKSIKNDSLVIETNAVVKIPFYRINWITTTTSINGILQTSHYRQLLNDKRREFTEISLDPNNLWEMTGSDGLKESIDISHQFYVSRSYFEEPVNQEYIFSERFGKSLELVHQGNGHYRLLLPDDNYSEYFYENGICKLVKAKNGSRTIKMVLSDSS
jgi:hypothetical protein